MIHKICLKHTSVLQLNQVALMASSVIPFFSVQFSVSLSIGATGFLTRQNGFDLLIRAFVGVTKIISSINFTVLGDGPETHKLKTLASSIGLKDSVISPGFQENPCPYFSHVDLFVLPSR